MKKIYFWKIGNTYYVKIYSKIFLFGWTFGHQKELKRTKDQRKTKKIWGKF